MRGVLQLTITLMVLFSGSLFATTYAVDPSHSQVGFKIKHMMISNVTGYFKSFDGSFAIEKGKLSALEGEVDVSSIDTDSAKRDNHLIQPDFFFASKFPKMQLKMTKRSGEKVEALLTIRDVTQKILLDVDHGGEITDPWGKKRAGIELRGTIDRTQFGVSYKAGSNILDNRVKIFIELEGIAE